MESAGELLIICGEAPTAKETIAKVTAANAPAPSPCLKVLPVGRIDEKPQFPRLLFGDECD